MKNFSVLSSFLLCFLFFLQFFTISIAQLIPSEARTLLQVQQQLEYPQVLQAWNNWTNFCYLPSSSSLSITCSNNHVTELTVVGNKTSPSKITNPTFTNLFVSQQILSQTFSIDSLFTVLTKLSHLKVLSLVSLGLWGPLQDKITRFRSLEVLNISSNFIYGGIPQFLSTFPALKSLVLADNLFNGSGPDLKSLQGLQILDLSNNNIGPQFPSLGNSLISITLRNNSLRSQIPPEFMNFDQLQVLDVSNNMVVGPIPSLLFSLASIQYLNLANNQLTGALSTNVTCSGKLAFVDISYNLLFGKLPACIGLNSRNRVVLSSWNCFSNGTSRDQHPYSFCQRDALAVKPVSQNRKQQHSAIKIGVVLGIVGGIVGIAGALGILIFFIYRRTEENQADELKCDRFVLDKGSSLRGSSITNGRRVPPTTRLSSFLPPYNNFTLEEIEDATDNFDPSNFVGNGSQGEIYKGCIRDGSIVFVNCLTLKQKQSVQNLQQHLDIVSKLRHRHLVSVLGHCIATHQDHLNTATNIFIVLEHLANESLRDNLTDWRMKEMLKWPQRMTISMGIARGIQFLHTGVTPGIFGNDLKIQNILLDDTLTPKISNYNISLPSKVILTSSSREWSNYSHNHSESHRLRVKAAVEQIGRVMDILDKFKPVQVIQLMPLITCYWVSQNKWLLELTFCPCFRVDQVSSESSLNGQDGKGDIYQFGVILLEMITGKLLDSEAEIDAFKLQLEESLAESPSKLREATDPSIWGTYAYESLKIAAQITVDCLNKDSRKRSSIEDVLWHMQYSVQVQEAWTSSGNLSTRL